MYMLPTDWRGNFRYGEVKEQKLRMVDEQIHRKSSQIRKKLKRARASTFMEASILLGTDVAWETRSHGAKKRTSSVSCVLFRWFRCEPRWVIWDRIQSKTGLRKEGRSEAHRKSGPCAEMFINCRLWIRPFELPDCCAGKFGKVTTCLESSQLECHRSLPCIGVLNLQSMLS